MSSYNSYTYYTMFVRCLRRYLEKEVEKRKKDKWITEPEILFTSVDEEGKKRIFNTFIIKESVEYIFDRLIEKAPSACLGADDWLDKFFNSVVREGFCTETWCGYDRCENFDHFCPYNCGKGKLPSKCDKWKAWRLSWRSYPEKEECQKCKHYKPVPHEYYRTELQTKQINEYKCYYGFSCFLIGLLLGCILGPIMWYLIKQLKEVMEK